jgi:hypothetical protein
MAKKVKKEEEKPVQKHDKKEEEKPVQKKKGKYDITVTPPEGMTFEDLLKMAVNTPPPKKNKK